MKLAEALSSRADIRTRISQLESRLYNNAKVQEGEAPAEDPEALLKETDILISELEKLVTRINHTNAVTTSDGESLTSLLARRDCLKLKLDIMRNFLSNASSTVSRGMRSEIKILSTVDVKEQQKKVDELSKELRELDVRIQSLNWSVDLI